ncbi:preprotein translocase subunit SecE [Mycoplasmopsis ciconiae]|uniref:Preprotein translocase subunit SecE n=1 Tax=Mycoplasmopsis ciconiae TaxID=561067 RepID=A0ABU7MM46_9BACT|nr:preprotein translocase subunit SecE [Mycoplasmopsis ciconiae]
MDKLKSIFDKKPNNKKPKKYYLRKMIKEIKRVRWPDKKKNFSSMMQIIIFTVLFVIFAFFITTIFTEFWSFIGIGN